MHKILTVLFVFILLFAMACSDDDNGSADTISGSWVGKFYYPDYPGGARTNDGTTDIIYLGDNSIQGFGVIGSEDNLIIKGSLVGSALRIVACEWETTNDFAILNGTISGNVITGVFTNFGNWAAGGNGTFSITNINGVR